MRTEEQKNGRETLESVDCYFNIVSGKLNIKLKYNKLYLYIQAQSNDVWTKKSAVCSLYF